MGLLARSPGHDVELEYEFVAIPGEQLLIFRYDVDNLEAAVRRSRFLRHMRLLLFRRRWLAVLFGRCKTGKQNSR